MTPTAPGGPWNALRRLTQARIGLGRAGHAVPTAALLDFQLAHAQARDAVHLPWDQDAFSIELKALELLRLESQVSGRIEYLKRPDLGRRLSAASREKLLQLRAEHGASDCVWMVSDGLSASAVAAHGAGLLRTLALALQQTGWKLSPLLLAPNARVAIADEAGELLGARLAIIVLGERPGLSASDSLGAYLTYQPKVGNTDAQRNCISNIRPPAGLSYDAAVFKLHYLATEAMRLKLSGVHLKDELPRELSVNPNLPQC